MFRSRNIRLGNHSINFESYDVMIILGFDGLGCKSFGHGTWLTKNYNCRQFFKKYFVSFEGLESKCPF